MKRKLINSLRLLLVAAWLCVGASNAWAGEITYNFNSWVNTNLTTLGQQQTLSVAGDNIATADATNVKVISDVTTPAFAFDGRFATDDVSKVYLRNGSSKSNQHIVNKGIQSRAADKHFSILNLKSGDIVTIVTGSGTTSFISTNATVGGIQVVSGDRVGTNVDNTDEGATTVCTMTADGNLDLKLGSWAVIMSVTINSPSVTLLDQPFTQLYEADGETEITDVTQYGYTVASGTNTSVTGGKLTFSGTSSSGVSAEVYSSFTEKSSGIINVSFTWATSNMTGLNGKTATTSNSAYTSFYLADSEGKKILTVYFFGQLQKIFVNGLADANLLYADNTDQVERGQTIAVTVDIDMDNKVIQSLKLVGNQTHSRTNFAFENSSATSIARFGYKNKNCSYVNIPTIDDILIKNSVPNYTLNAILSNGTKLKTIYQGCSDFASSQTVYFPKYINVNNTWYKTSETSFSKAFSTAGTQTVTYAADDAIDYFFEFEELPKNGSFAANVSGATVSSGMSGRLHGSSKQKARAWTGALAGGTYTLISHCRGANSNSTLPLYYCDVDGSNPVYIGEATASASTSSFSERTTTNIVIPEGKALCFYNNTTSNSNHYVDYFTLTRNGNATVSATITSAGFATNVSAYALDFTSTSIKAYKVKVSSKGVATLTKVNQVPAGTPVLLYKDGGATENIPVIASADAVSDNDLVAGTGDAVATTDGGYTNMILNNVDSKIGFYFANGKIVASNRAYLHIATGLAPDAEGGSSSRMVMAFADETTGITSLTPSPSPKGEGSVYTLSGQRVEKPAKGLYIVNGKKVIIK